MVDGWLWLYVYDDTSGVFVVSMNGDEEWTFEKDKLSKMG